MAPVQSLLIGFILIPSIFVAWMSLTHSSLGRETEFIGLANYVTILTDPIFWRSFWNTFIVVNAIVYGELILGLVLALAFAGWMPFKKIAISIILAPFAITHVSAVVMWRYMLEPDAGIINLLLEFIGFGQLYWTVMPSHALVVVSLMGIWLHLPFTFLILYAAATTLPNELIEAAYVDGATSWQVVRQVKLPLLMPAILVALLFRYIIAMRLFTEVWLLTEGGPARLTEVLAVYLYRQAFRYHDFGVAAATGWAILVLSLIIAIPYLVKMYRTMFRDV